MSTNKQTIETYIDGFNKSDHQQILNCLTDDVVWEMPGLFYLQGKQEFDGEIENPAFSGQPVIVITRLAEEGDVVIVEGTVDAHTSDGSLFKARFLDWFDMHDGKIKKLTGYITPLQAAS